MYILQIPYIFQTVETIVFIGPCMQASLVQTVMTRKGKISPLLSAVLLGLAASCGNNDGKLATTVNEMEGFYPTK